MKKITIKSIYGEDESEDGIYVITYPEDVDIKQEILRATNYLECKGCNVNELSEVLEYLIGDGINLDYEQLHYDLFDIDYFQFLR